MNKKILLLICLIFPIFINAGPISTLYGTGWYNKSLHIIQGDNLIKKDLMGYYESGIVVLDTVKTFPYHYTDSFGVEYSTAGDQIGTTQYPIDSVQGVLDATTDGSYIYAMSYYYTPGIYRFDLNWQNPEFMFNPTITSTLSGSRSLGIAYDPTDSTFWITTWGNSQITHYDMEGTILSSFNAISDHNGGLAYDYADGTLWTWTNANQLEQYSRTGSLLSTAQYDFNGYIYGLEAAFIPEVNSIILLLMSFLGCIFLEIKK